MKKLFPLHHPRKADGRVLDAIKHDVRKYVQRELNKTRPDVARRPTFSCRVGASEAEAQETPLKNISAAIDRVAQEGANDVFIAITSTPAEESTR